ncbi:beta-alanine-activating enzyme isoform X2 [Uranotaenia lowii]|nr:beta-alanine-activating enzyme isoform X2 [Uranotaenia lowii]
MLKLEVFQENAAKEAIVYHTKIGNRWQFSYGRLWEEIENIRKFIGDTGFQTEGNISSIGLILNHSAVLIAAICGINLSGLEFCCLYSETRNLESILSTLATIGTNICVCRENFIRSLEESNHVFKILKKIEILNEKIHVIRINLKQKTIRPVSGIVYAVATSGSTGQPKLVRVPLKCILPNLEALERIGQVTERDRVFISSPPTFDPFILDVFLALRNGACLVMADRRTRLWPARLLESVILPEKISFVQITPSLFCHWMDDSKGKALLEPGSSLRTLIVGGEPFPRSLMKLPVGCPVQVFNVYGITEISCWATIQKLAPELDVVDVPIGVPLDPSIELILHDVDTGLPIIVNGKLNVRGELYIGSSSRKCLVGDENWELTEVSKMLYRRTGDLVERRGDGGYYYVGRCDHMIKRFGVRVGLSRIESTAERYRGISRTCCVFKPDSNKIVLFYTGCDKPTTEFRKFLSSNLDQAEVPDDLQWVNEFPLSTHGKIDRRALLQMMNERGEELCIEYWFKRQISNLFGVFSSNSVDTKRVRFDTSVLDKSFIDFGGTSIQALRIVTDIQENFHLKARDLMGMLLDQSISIEAVLGYLRTIRAVSSREICTEFSVNSQKIVAKPVYDLGKCIDATPTIIVSKKYILLAVGSHSHKVAVLKVDAESETLVSELVLPDRVESPVTTLDEELGLVGCYNGFMYCFELWTGKIRWSFDSGGMIKSQAVVVDGSIFYGSYGADFNLFSLDKEGSPIWKQKIGSKGILSRSTYLGNGTIFVATLDGTCTCLSVNDGCSRWIFKLDSPVFANIAYHQPLDILAVAEVRGLVHCLSASSGKEIWNIPIEANLFSTPTILQHPNSIDLIFGCHDQHVYCYQWKTTDNEPSLKWKSKLQSPIYSGVLVTNNLALVCTTAGYVNLVSLTYEGKVVGCAKLEGEVFSTPVALLATDSFFVGCRDNNIYRMEVYSKTSRSNLDATSSLCFFKVPLSTPPIAIGDAVHHSQDAGVVDCFFGRSGIFGAVLTALDLVLSCEKNFGNFIS